MMTRQLHGSQAPPPAGGTAPEPQPEWGLGGPDRADADRQRVMHALELVYDACCEERKISIVDMGLIDSVAVVDGHARVQMVLTTGWCPFSGGMITDAEARLRELPGLTDVTVEVTWDKTWDTSRMTPAVAAGLRLLPEPSQVPDKSAFLAQAAASRRPHPEGATS